MPLFAFLSLLNQNRRSQQRYETMCYQNGVFNNDQDELKQKAIKICEEDLNIQFPEGAELLYANSDKGSLFDWHVATSFKLKIQKEKRDHFEAYIQSGDKTGVYFQKADPESFYSGRGPREIWRPEVLKNQCAIDLTEKVLMEIGCMVV